jgi:hypothetical protein
MEYSGTASYAVERYSPDVLSEAGCELSVETFKIMVMCLKNPVLSRFIAVQLFVALAYSVDAGDYRYVDSLMRVYPLRNARSTEDIAKYIRSRFVADGDRLRAAYSWVAQNVTYDVSKMHTGITYKHESEVVDLVLKTRKTVCFGYVVTFKDIAERLGIRVVVVKGYTKQNGRIDAIPHAWCAVMSGGKWRLIDPTWSSGYLSSGVFHQRFNDKWYLVHPDRIIQSHIPFDPVWQFSYFPINGDEFAAGVRADSVTARFFCYPDTVMMIEHQPEKERLRSENRRVLSMCRNRMCDKHVAVNERSIEYIVHNENVDTYNRAVTAYNSAALMFNGDSPRSAAAKLREASYILSLIQNPNKSMSASIADLKKMINKLESQLNKIL